ncbi:MAG: SAM-dependent methyltransferase [Candidatus Kariarchaeaceae archaeon]
MWYDSLIRRGLVPEFILRRAIRAKIQGRFDADPDDIDSYTAELYTRLEESPIAIHEPTANDQHYELPVDFFLQVLGPQLKYSSCYFEGDDLTEAEDAMLQLTVQRAGVQDGERILDLGCGWGSLSLYLATHFPQASITALSNSRTQKAYIDKRASELGLTNLQVITGNIATIEVDDTFDRILSVEMFEHMRNYRALFAKLKSWLKHEGTLFVHIFARHGVPYLFEADDSSNFMAQLFFTGGTMPSVGTLPHFAPPHFDLTEEWEVNGSHYQKTLEAWYQLMLERKASIMPVLQETYGKDARAWWHYWRIFFIANAELFGFKNGEEWVVKHYRFTRL